MLLATLPGMLTEFTLAALPYGLLLLLVFFARVIDVSLQTMRIIFISRGKKNIAPLLGFVEVFIWIAATGQLVRNLNDVWSYLAYAAGFAVGSYLGMYIDGRLALGTKIIRTIIPGDARDLTLQLHDAGYGVTSVPGQGSAGPVTMVYSIVKRRSLPEAVGIIHNLHPRAFVSIQDVSAVEKGIFPDQGHPALTFDFTRKGK
ncbi:DUF2179 domain-containing protein [bacterium]|nr:DUF2179 domain-containing protein [bacterium]